MAHIKFNGHTMMAVETGYTYGDQKLYLVPGERPGQVALVAPAGPHDPERIWGMGSTEEMWREATLAARP